MKQFSSSFEFENLPYEIITSKDNLESAHQFAEPLVNPLARLWILTPNDDLPLIGGQAFWVWLFFSTATIYRETFKKSHSIPWGPILMKRSHLQAF